MMEIYEKHADRYDELVRAEDYRGNLWKALEATARWKGATVLEAGVGTGRVTGLYAASAARALCLDGSRHMIEFARNALSQQADKIEFGVADNLSLPAAEDPFDIFIEGWAFGHSVVDAPDRERVSETTEHLVANAVKNVRPGGTALILETLGTNVTSPGAPTETLGWFYDELELTHGFVRREVSTDYRFGSIDEAVRVMAFFFGREMGASVRERGALVVPEWTGLWIKHV